MRGKLLEMVNVIFEKLIQQFFVGLGQNLHLFWAKGGMMNKCACRLGMSFACCQREKNAWLAELERSLQCQVLKKSLLFL